jgi:hypothetical protein
MELAELEPRPPLAATRVGHDPPTELYIGTMTNPRSF